MASERKMCKSRNPAKEALISLLVFHTSQSTLDLTYLNPSLKMAGEFVLNALLFRFKPCRKQLKESGERRF